MREPNFEIDENVSPHNSINPLSEWVKKRQFSLGFINDYSLLDKEDVDYIKMDISAIHDRKTDVIKTNITDTKHLQKIIPDEARFITIWPHSNKFGWIKTNLYKGFFKNQNNHKIDDFIYFYNIIKYVDRRFSHIVVNSKDTVDYGDLYNISFLKILFLKVNGEEASSKKIDWASEYIGKQFSRIDDSDLTNFGKLRRKIDPKDLFDVAVLLFLFERNNPHIKRNWTIKDIPNDFYPALAFLDENHKKYQ